MTGDISFMEPWLTRLFPRPKRLEELPGSLHLPMSVRVVLLGEARALRPAALRLVDTLRKEGLQPSLAATFQEGSRSKEPFLSLRLQPSAFAKPESYRIALLSDGLTVVGADEAGLFYGVSTLSQLISLAMAEQAPPVSSAPHLTHLVLPCLHIEDAPDFRHRGVMLDISRDKVPTMDTLYTLVERLASWKINQVQLYMEHTFAYEGHEQVWEGASPMTGEEILALDAYCRERHIELVPNQNSFGHMHRWLMHEPYNHLAECPEGIEHPFNRRKEPFGLCPMEPDSLAFLDDLYGQLLPHFGGDVFNVGLDETFDLGKGRSQEACEANGTASVYLSFLREIAELARRYNRRIQFWADIVLKDPSHLDAIPRDAIGMIWGYEAGHPFEEQCEALAKVGLPFYVCPGTSSWNSFAGRTDNAIGNLKEAAQHGLASGAIGYLNTDWGDFGHMQPLPVSYLGFMAGAGFSWNAHGHDAYSPEDWVAALNHHAFFDPSGTLGQVAYDLGNAYAETGARSFNASPLFRLLVLCDRHAPKDTEHISRESLAGNRSFVERVTSALASHQSQLPDAEWIQKEFKWIADVLCFACDFATARMGTEDEAISDIPEAQRKALSVRLRSLMEQHRKQWLLRNRPGGLQDSLQQFGFVLEQLQ
jgi:hypothetical protein